MDMKEPGSDNDPTVMLTEGITGKANIVRWLVAMQQRPGYPGPPGKNTGNPTSTA